MSMGAYKKVFLTFSSIFWPVQEPFIGLILCKEFGKHDNDIEFDPTVFVGNYMQIDNFWAKHGIPSMEVTLVGDGAAWSSGRSDDEIRNVVLEFIQKAMFGNAGCRYQEGINIDTHNNHDNISSLCVGCHVTRWEEDKYSKGAYSGYVLGTNEQHVQDLGASEWDGTLLFAGEATNSSYEGTVHAALLSGKDVSIQVMSKIFAS